MAPSIGLFFWYVDFYSFTTAAAGASAWTLTSIAFPLSIAVVTVGFMARPEYLQASRGPLDLVVDRLHESPNPSENNAYFWGFVEADNSPILIDRSLFSQHVHILGNSGSGKTAIGLSPTVEQSIRFGDFSCFVIDLKADSRELLATCFSARAWHKERTGIELP